VSVWRDKHKNSELQALQSFIAILEPHIIIREHFALYQVCYNQQNPWLLLCLLNQFALLSLHNQYIIWWKHQGASASSSTWKVLFSLPLKTLIAGSLWTHLKPCSMSGFWSWGCWMLYHLCQVHTENVMFRIFFNCIVKWRFPFTRDGATMHCNVCTATCLEKLLGSWTDTCAQTDRLHSIKWIKKTL
jgi:hypothetical protein